MTITPKKYPGQPATSSDNNTSLRSHPVQMEDLDGLRLKFFSEDSVSLASSAAEPINIEDKHYAELRGELESDAQELEAESWSSAVDQNYLKALSKEAVKRQDVIYELMQTEMHHVRTLKILRYVYMHELKESLQMEEATLKRLFPGLDLLLPLHQHLLNCLKVRCSQSLEDLDCPHNYQISQLGDILINQFSGDLGERMKDCYGVFCSHQSDSVSFYKEQLQNNKKLQSLIKKISQLSLVRRLGIPECFLLVTQRITKYPVLLERIIQNTEADTEEHESLVQALALIKDTISQVNDQVDDYEKAARLRDISLRLEPKSQGRLKDGRLFRREDLIQGNRTLLHEGTVTWKTVSGKNKDILAVLLTDVLLLLQEKDQKLIFAAVDNKPPVISLQKLIIREVAHEDKAMFLINTSSSQPVMYEIHAASREERNTWMTLIWEAVGSCPEGEEELYAEQERRARLREYQESLMMRDAQIAQSLMEKLQIFTALNETVTGQEASHSRLLLRGDATDLQQGETLLKGAITEVENLQNLLYSGMRGPNLLVEESQEQRGALRRAHTFAWGDSSPMRNGGAVEQPGSSEGSLGESGLPAAGDPPLQDLDLSESLEQSADDDTLMPCPPLMAFPEAEVYDRVTVLSQRLYSLQAIVAQQDSQLELQRALLAERERPARHRNNVLLEQEKQRNLEKQKEELANFQKLQVAHRQEMVRWEKERERHRVQAEVLEAQLQQREEECRRLEEWLAEERAELERQRETYQQDLERLRESTRTVEKEKEKLEQKMLKRNLTIAHTEPAQLSPLFLSQSFRGDMRTPKPSIRPSIPPTTTTDPSEVPPMVPPRKESISPLPPKAEVPIHLISTTNQAHKALVQQQIPTKLAAFSKGKEKSSKTKGSHQRTHSAASIDMSQVVPIRVMGKEGGSLRAKRTASPQRISSADAFTHLAPVGNVKPSQSFSVHRKSMEASPPEPPPFPKEVLLPPFPKDLVKTGKERVIFF